MALRLLLRAHWRSRAPRIVAAAAVFAVGFLVFLGLSMVLGGAKEGIVAPLRDTTTGDLRVTQGDAGMAGGRPWEDARGAAQDLRHAAGGSVSLRWETPLVVVRPDDPEAWAGGLLYGLDPADVVGRRALEDRLVWGRAVAEQEVRHPETGHNYRPLVVGELAAKRLNLSLDPSGAPDFDAVVVLTSGRMRPDRPDPMPYTVEAVVVGVFRTGLDPVDRFTAYAPIEAARALVGRPPTESSANALVLWGGDAAAGGAWARQSDLQAVEPVAFGRQYMGGVFLVLDAVAVLSAAALLGVLLLWLVHETGVVVRADQHILGALRAVGIPQSTLTAVYAASAAAVAAGGAAAAVAVAWLWSALAPPLALEAPGLAASVPWRLPAQAVALPAAAVLAAALVAAWSAARRVGRLDLLEAMRGS